MRKSIIITSMILLASSVAAAQNMNGTTSISRPTYTNSVKAADDNAFDYQQNRHYQKHRGMYTAGKSSEWEFERVNDTSSFLLSKKGKGLYLGHIKISGEKVFRNGLGVIKENDGRYLYCRWKRDFADGAVVIKSADSAYSVADYKLGVLQKGTQRDASPSDISAIECEIARLEAMAPYFFKD